MAIYGAWGSGKSSIKNMVVESLRAPQQPCAEVVDFDPWQMAQRAPLAETFFEKIGIAPGQPDVASRENRKQLLNRWRRYAARLRVSGRMLRVLVQPLRLVLAISGAVLLLGWFIDLRTSQRAEGPRHTGASGNRVGPSGGI